jgi:glyoxylase-like metal-dependent hydrolase (beta-lactamase superfamily II)
MIKKISENIFQLHFRNFGSCIYVLKLEKIILIDTSTQENRAELIEDLKKLGLSPEEVDYILITHNHYDHVGNINIFPNAKIPNKKEIEESRIKIIKTPGHTSDSVCFLYNRILFSGDTLFHNGIGRTDLPTGDEEQIEESLKKLENTDYDILCPGHID